MKDEIAVDLLASVRCAVFEQPALARLDESIIEEFRKVLDRVGGEGEGHGEDQHATGFQQPPRVDEGARHRRRDVLEDVARNDEVVFLGALGRDVGDVEARLGVEVCIGVPQIARKP